MNLAWNSQGIYMQAMCDLEDDVHPGNFTMNQISITFSESEMTQLLDLLANKLSSNSNFQKTVYEVLDSYMRNEFDINDYTSNLDTYALVRNITDEVCSEIAQKLS